MTEERINVLSAGERFSYKGFDFICLDPDCEGGVLAIMAEAWTGKEMQFDAGNNNNYATSSLRKKLLSDLLPVLGVNNLLPHTVDLTADNGDDRYGTVTDKVFILSCDEYRKYRKYVPLLNEWMWTCTPWWINDAGYGSYVRSVYPAGDIYHNGADNSNGVASACIFNPSNLKLRRQAHMEEI